MAQAAARHMYVWRYRHINVCDSAAKWRRRGKHRHRVSIVAKIMASIWRIERRKASVWRNETWRRVAASIINMRSNKRI